MIIDGNDLANSASMVITDSASNMQKAFRPAIPAPNDPSVPNDEEKEDHR